MSGRSTLEDTFAKVCFLTIIMFFVFGTISLAEGTREMRPTSADHGYLQLDNGWNNYIHGVAGPLSLQDPINDSRDASTKFVHVQLRGADYFSDEQLYHITNSARSKWNVEGIS